jgi:hypothetical protein
MNEPGGPITPGPVAASRPARALLVVLVLAASIAVGTPSAQALRSPNGPDSLSVYRLYRAAFLREPDTGGLTYWYQAQLDGMALSDIAEHFVHSSEFVGRYGDLDAPAFVDRMYRNVFDRPADLAGEMHWVQRLGDETLTRGGVLLGLADSAEHKATTLATAAGPVDLASYSFLRHDRHGAPERWDPCTPIDVVVNLDHAPPAAEAWITVALLRMSDATGVEWRLLGGTDEWYGTDIGERPGVDVARYGERWAPILIHWDPELQSRPEHAQFRHGMHGVVSVTVDSGRAVTVSGAVVLGPDASTGPRDLVGYTTHLLGNVFGLGPSSEPGNVMHRGRTAAGWGPGDLEGFRQLRAGGCIDTPGPVIP